MYNRYPMKDSQEWSDRRSLGTSGDFFSLASWGRGIVLWGPFMAKIFVGLSGGVDSSVAAALLKQQVLAEPDLCVEAVFMQNWRGQDESCTIKDDYRDAQAIAKQLDIPLHFVDFADRYWEDVFEYFLEEIESGRTPNPDILCNQHVKFDAFYHWAQSEGATRIATGHYARLMEGQLAQAEDKSKDQSYFLWAVPPSVLKNCVFPLGDWEKSHVRRWAADHNLISSNKKDSTGICFIGPKNFRKFLKQYLCARPGPIISTDGATLGEHQGALFYTLGQRSGLNVGGVSGHDQLPWYVVSKDLSNNTITVSQDQSDPRLISQTLTASRVNWHGRVPHGGRVLTRFRHLQPLQEAWLETAETDEEFRLRFSQPQRAINAGQAIVIYDGELCVAGGWID